jgi:hypothetical protein
MAIVTGNLGVRQNISLVGDAPRTRRKSAIIQVLVAGLLDHVLAAAPGSTGRDRYGIYWIIDGVECVQPQLGRCLLGVQRHPPTARFVLSDPSSRTAIYRK